MASGSRSTLFGMTLTELVIVLFFIMLLLALDNIEDLNDQIPDLSEDMIASSEVVELLIPDGEINSDLIPFDVIKDEIAKLQKDKEDFQNFKEGSEATEDGDCEEGGYWINSKCADHCWAVDDNGNYDVLLDIGVCPSNVNVQRSQWLNKSESDFLQVPGALAASEKSAMSEDELYGYLDSIMKPGYEKTPRQCFHVVRLVQLEQMYAGPWSENLLEVQGRVSTELYTLDMASYDSVRGQFPEDICNIPNEADTASIEVVLSDIPDVRLFQEPETRGDTKALPENILNVIEPKLEPSSFFEEFTKECSRSRPIRNKRISLNYEIALSNIGDVISVESLSQDNLINSSLNRLDIMAKEAIIRSKFSPKYIGDNAVSSTLIQAVPFGENACN